MSKFTKTVRREFEFEDDTVVVVLSRLKRKDFMGLMPYMQKAADGMPEDSSEVVGTMDMVQMMDFSADLLPDYVVSMTGLRDDDDKELEFSDIAGEAYFMELLSEIVSALFEASNMGKKDRKNSQGQSTIAASEPELSEDSSSANLHVRVGLESLPDAEVKPSGVGPTAKAI